MNNYSVQVESNIYRNDNYLSESRFLSFREQIVKTIQISDIETIIEIGKGNGFTSAVLKNFGYKVITVDFDPELKPDIVCSVLEIKKNIHEKYDLVQCFEVLEHLKFEDFPKALENLKSIAKRYILISLPYVGISFKFSFYISKLDEKKLEFLFRLPLFWKKHKFNGHHYWEPGKVNFSKKRVRRELSKHLKIKEEWLFPYNKSQVFYLCEV